MVKMKLDYMQCWNGAMSLLAQHKEAILAVAGVFVFLPTILMAQFVGEPVLSGGEDADALIAAFSEHFNENAAAIILSNLLISFGGLVMYFTFAPSRSASLADDMSAAIKIFLFYLIASLLSGFATLAGLMLFILPGLYIAARLVLMPVYFADTSERSPIEVLKRSWEATKDNGFSILFFILMISIVCLITIGVLQAVIGVVTGLVSGGTGWPLLENLVASITGTAFQILLTAVISSIYIQMTGSKTDVQEVFN